MDIDRAELWFQWDDVAGREADLERALQAIPGVASVELIRPDDTTAEARVRVAFDPGRTNPVVMEEALGREGFTVLSAGERPTAS